MKQLTTVITNSGRPEHLWRAFKSCRAAGIDNIVVASAPMSRAVRQVHLRIKYVLPRVKIINFADDPGCNATWLAGVNAAETEWVNILHDDDLLLPEFKDAGIEQALADKNLAFVMYDSGSHDANSETFQPIHKYVDLWTKTGGMFSPMSLRRRLLEADLSISPVSGIFRKSHLVSVLSEFQSNCVENKKFDYRPNMQVGNDLLIWLRATELSGYFIYTKKALVSYGSHEGSTTCSDLSGAKRLPEIYKHTKEYWQLTAKDESTGIENVATFLYLPAPEKARSFLEHLNFFRRALPLHILSDANTTTAGITKIPKIGPFQAVGLCAASDQYAFMAFLRIVLQAKELGLDYFILVESDCRFSSHEWDLRMWEEFSKWPTKALFGGTPVCWHPWANGERDGRSLIDYAYKYQRASGVCMAFEGEHSGPWGTAIYPNGALAIYNVAECLEYFALAISHLESDLVIQGHVASSHHAFDLHIGRSLVKKYGVPGALRRLAFLPSVYSGCKNHHVSQEQRIEMINSKKKVAIHQIK